MAVERVMETTAYCNCGRCCSWEHGLLLGPKHYLSLGGLGVKLRRRRRNPYHDKSVKERKFIFDRYWTSTTLKGCVYEGKTAQGDLPRQARPGPLHPRSLTKPIKLALRVALAPWCLLGRTGTIAADLESYPFGTRMYVPGYGWGEVKDCGSAIKGPHRLDLFFSSHKEALKWGRQQNRVKIVRQGRFSRPVEQAILAWHAIFSG